MIDVRRNDRASARHFGAHKLGIHAFTQCNEFHLSRDLTAPRVVHLRDALSRHCSIHVRQ